MKKRKGLKMEMCSEMSAIQKTRMPYIANAYDAVRDIEDVIWVWNRDEFQTGNLREIVIELRKELDNVCGEYR